MVTLLSMLIVQVSWETEIVELVELYSEDSPEMAIHQLGRLYTFIVKVSCKTELIASVEMCLTDGLKMVGSYSENCLEMIVHQEHLVRNSAWSLIRSPGTELFWSLEIYSKGGLEMARLYLADGLEMGIHQ